MTSEILPAFGEKLSELISRHQLPDGTPWTLGYFATLVGTTEDQVRAWMAGAEPEPTTLVRIEEALLVDGPALLRGEVRPMTLPLAQRTTGEWPAADENP